MFDTSGYSPLLYTLDNYVLAAIAIGCVRSFGNLSTEHKGPKGNYICIYIYICICSYVPLLIVASVKG